MRRTVNNGVPTLIPLRQPPSSSRRRVHKGDIHRIINTHHRFSDRVKRDVQPFFFPETARRLPV